MTLDDGEWQDGYRNGWRDGRNAVGSRVRAFAKDCVTQGDMTPMAARMLGKIADEIEGKQT